MGNYYAICPSSRDLHQESKAEPTQGQIATCPLMCLGVHLPLLGSSRSHSYFDFEQDARAFMSSTCTLFIVRSGHQISNQGLGRPQHWPTDWSTEYRTGQLACKQEKASPRLADCAIKPPKSRTQSALVKFTANSIRPRSVGATTNPHNHARWPLATLGSRPPAFTFQKTQTFRPPLVFLAKENPTATARCVRSPETLGCALG